MKTLVNTIYFQDSAIHFEKHGVYTSAPKDSYEYIDFWEEERRRCIEGYSVGDLWITGKHYAYLNYGFIERIKTKEELSKNSLNKMIFSRPRFFMVDYEYWILKHICQHGATSDDLAKYDLPFLDRDKVITPGKHLSILKTRRGGFSYKEAFEGAYNMNFIPQSKSHYFAATEEALTKDGIINKVTPMLDFMYKYTELGRLRQVKNTFKHMRSSYIDDSLKIEAGYMSECYATVLDKKDKARGKSGIKLTFEEGGSFPGLLDCLIVCRPQVEQAGIVKGYITVFGTGGNASDEGLHGLQSIHDNPAPYNFLSVNNIWEEDAGDTCGYFVPATMVRENFMDADGNLDLEGAEGEILAERALIEQTGIQDALTKTAAENPLTPEEALARVTTTYFPTDELKRRAKYLKLNPEYLDKWVPVRLSEYEGKVVVTPNVKASSVDEYPIDKNKDMTSTVRMVQAPRYDVNGRVPDNMYLIAVDPYSVDNSEESSSIGSIRVFKRPCIGIPNDEYTNSIVARYDGRPKIVEMFWEIAFLLAKLYNTKVQSELAGGGQNGIVLARLTKQTSLLRPQITISNNTYKEKTNSYFIKTNSSESKNQGLLKLNEWVSSVVGYMDDEETEPIYRYQVLDDLPLILEMISYKYEKNFDRVSSMIVMMHEKEQMTIKEARAAKNSNTSGKPKRFINCH